MSLIRFLIVPSVVSVPIAALIFLIEVSLVEAFSSTSPNLSACSSVVNLVAAAKSSACPFALASAVSAYPFAIVFTEPAAPSAPFKVLIALVCPVVVSFKPLTSLSSLEIPVGSPNASQTKAVPSPCVATYSCVPTKITSPRR